MVSLFSQIQYLDINGICHDSQTLEYYLVVFRFGATDQTRRQSQVKSRQKYLLFSIE